jgi:hypothetical protein
MQEEADETHDGWSARLRAAGFNPVGTTLVLLGAFLVLCAFTLLDWFRDGPGFFAGAGSSTTFSQLHALLTQRAHQVEQAGLQPYVSFGVAKPYFGWLGWVLLLASFACGMLASSQLGGRHWSLRWLAAVVCVSAVALSFVALNLITFEKNAPNNANAPSYGDFLVHSGIGAWVAILGFVAILVGSVLPRSAD